MLDVFRGRRLTGKQVIEIDMNQGGFGNISFYSQAAPHPGCKRLALFAGSSGPVVMEKVIK
jgi:hypothetical protein